MQCSDQATAVIVPAILITLALFGLHRAWPTVKEIARVILAILLVVGWIAACCFILGAVVVAAVIMAFGFLVYWIGKTGYALGCRFRQ